MNGDQKPTLDPAVLMALRDAIGNKINDIITLYIDDVPNSLQQMYTSLEANDLVTVGRLAHSLKSSSANLGAIQTSTLAAELENSIKNGISNSLQILEAIQKIQQSVDQSLPLFRDYLK